jgi:(E)-4-hydroxy-3-methylbut-2-enyl-diphosphate synthase
MATETSAHPFLPFTDSLFSYKRREARVVMVGDVPVGGTHPIVLQSMATTRTQDTEATVAQSIRMIQSGAQIVRITAPTEVDAKNLKNIKASLVAKGYKTPIVADIHFRPEAAMEAANWVEKVRVNPGNFADSKAFKIKEYSDAQYNEELQRIEERFTPLVMKLKKLGRAVRVGTNHGSLSDRIMNRYGDTPEGMVESALEFVRICRKNDFHEIILSMKASNPKVMIAAYRLLAAQMTREGMDYPFHLGVTEAGDGEDGRIKSAIGIGSLLEDGIGDTIRVSLTEDPELELPVCAMIAAPYHQRKNGSVKIDVPTGFAGTHTQNFYHYARRPSRVVKLGPFSIGGENTVPLVTRRDEGTLTPQGLLTLMEEQLKNSKDFPPEIIEWNVETRGDLNELAAFCEPLKEETGRLAILARVRPSNPLAIETLKKEGVHAVCLAFPPSARLNGNLTGEIEAARKIIREAKALQKPLFLEADDATFLAALAREAAAASWNLVLSLNRPDASSLICHTRFLTADSFIRESAFPIHLRAPQHDSYDEHRIQASILFGSLLCDGIGDSVQAGLGKNLKEDLQLLYNLLQGAGVRITKTEYVSCPSCGRTLFDLQSTTERIKSKTGHLKGVKIAIMGCIVNGPGEMADADFGYVGGGPDKINLYVGKECVQKGIPAEIADEKLIELIKTHGKWVDPVPQPV